MISVYQEAIDRLCLLKEDVDSSKTFKDRVEVAVKILKSGEELALEKALSELEELGSHDVSSYHRTQLWDVISLLESMK